MKITLINKSDSGGGAAAASYRLTDALRSQQFDARLLVQDKSQHDGFIDSTIQSSIDSAQAKFNFLAERIPFIIHEKDKSVRFAFSTASTGTSISGHASVKSADLLHLHWTNAGFLSIRGLNELFNLQKPIVWTLHDMWPFTGGCHYSSGCDHFLKSCGNCPMLKNPHPRDSSRAGWIKKEGLYQDRNKLVFVACSNWLRDIARQSSLLAGFRVEAIPNPIDVDVFSPKDKLKSREKWNINPASRIILFGAANINDRRKGIGYLTQAFKKLKAQYPDENTIEVVFFGKNNLFDTSVIPFPVKSLGIIRSQEDLAEIYSMADVYILPSVEDNLPNMVMESLSCATPVVAFDTGGLPEMVDHLANGYLAKYRSADDLAAGINWVLEQDGEMLRKNARNKVLQYFSYPVIAKRYAELYRELLQDETSDYQKA